MSLLIKKTKVNISSESIDGVLKIKNYDISSQQIVHGFFVELVQQEI